MLKGYYSFEQIEGRLLDLSGNSLDSTSVNVTSRNATGILNGNCFQFDSTTDYVSLGQSFQFSDSEAFSISVWFKRTSQIPRDSTDSSMN